MKKQNIPHPMIRAFSKEVHQCDDRRHNPRGSGTSISLRRGDHDRSSGSIDCRRRLVRVSCYPDGPLIRRFYTIIVLSGCMIGRNQYRRFGTEIGLVADIHDIEHPIRKTGRTQAIRRHRQCELRKQSIGQGGIDQNRENRRGPFESGDTDTQSSSKDAGFPKKASSAASR